jgi:transposase
MDLVHVVRHKVLVEGRTQRAVAREVGLARVTVRKYLDQAVPTRKLEAAPRPRPVWDAVADRVQALLTESVRWPGGKQRLTATRLHELLLREGHHVGVTLVKDAVAERKRQRREVFVPLTYRPGDLAEVDFFEVLDHVDGTRRKAWLFLRRLMYSGRDFAWIYERQDQISFLDGHVRAFAHFGGVPARVASDNLRAAVVRILVGGARTLTPRFTALASHYLLEACFCRPGEGHDTPCALGQFHHRRGCVEGSMSSCWASFALDSASMSRHARRRSVSHSTGLALRRSQRRDRSRGAQNQSTREKRFT